MMGPNCTCLQKQKDQVKNKGVRLPQDLEKGRNKYSEEASWFVPVDLIKSLCGSPGWCFLVLKITAVYCGDEEAKKGWWVGSGDTVSFRGNGGSPPDTEGKDENLLCT